MADDWDLLIRVAPEPELDQDEVVGLTLRLRDELLELDVERVDRAPQDVPESTKSAHGPLGLMTVKLGKAALKAVISKIRDWVARTTRSVELTIDGDTLKVTNVTAEQQETLINAWLARHAAPST